MEWNPITVEKNKFLDIMNTANKVVIENGFIRKKINPLLIIGLGFCFAKQEDYMNKIILRDEYLQTLKEFKDKDIIKIVTGAYVKIGLNQEKPYKTRV